MCRWTPRRRLGGACARDDGSALDVSNAALDVQLSDVSPSSVCLGISRTSRLPDRSLCGLEAIRERGSCYKKRLPKKAVRVGHPEVARPTQAWATPRNCLQSGTASSCKDHALNPNLPE